MEIVSQEGVINICVIFRSFRVLEFGTKKMRELRRRRVTD